MNNAAGESSENFQRSPHRDEIIGLLAAAPSDGSALP
jgi:hypothetical protein